MENKKITVTVGIPAYNEEGNIKNLLNSILSQRQDYFNLEKIIVISDGSVDSTEQKVREISSDKIKLIADGKRLSKPIRINHIFKESDSDIVVIFDADIKLESDNVLNNLIKPFFTDDAVMLVSGKARPLAPDNFIQKVIYTGVKMWDEVKSQSGSMMYFCEGPVRAFRKDLYKEINFPTTSADDVYPYLFSIKKGYKFHYAEKAVVRHKLPSTYPDYVRQSRRYLNSQNIQEKNFGFDFIRKNYTVTFAMKAKVLLINIFINPFWTTAYLVFMVKPKLLSAFSGKKRKIEGSSLWEIVKSTK